MQAHADIPGDFRYRPTTDITMPGHHVSLAASPLGGGGGGIAIPVVHLGSSSMSSVATASPGYFSNRPTSVSASPGGMRGGSMATGGVGVGGGVLRKTSLPNPATDPEAEVDALTSVLMQKMETPRSGGVMSPHETSTGGTSSPGRSSSLSVIGLPWRLQAGHLRVAGVPRCPQPTTCHKIQEHARRFLETSKDTNT